MYQKIALLILLSSPLVISADHHAKKGDKSKKEVKKMVKNLSTDPIFRKRVKENLDNFGNQADQLDLGLNKEK